MLESNLLKLDEKDIREIIVNTQFLKLNISYYPLKKVTNYLSNSITYKVISGGNSLSYQKHVQVIHELTRNSIISKFCYLFLLLYKF